MFVRSENKKVIIDAKSIYIKKIELEDGEVFKVKALGLTRKTPITLKTYKTEDEALKFLDQIMGAAFC